MLKREYNIFILCPQKTRNFAEWAAIKVCNESMCTHEK